MKRIQILPIIQQIPSNDDTFKIVYVRPDQSEITVVSPSQLYGYFVNFADWYLLKPESDTRTDYEYFVYIWQVYRDSKAENWKMLFKALYSDYEPIDNYDIHESTTRTLETGDKTFEHAPDGVKDTATVTVENGTGTNAPKTQHFVATYQSAEKAFEYTTNTGKTTTTTETEMKSTYTDTTTKEDDTETTTTHRHGNAGVMTTAEVIRQETELRKSELAFDIVLGGFVDSMLFYSGVIE